MRRDSRFSRKESINFLRLASDGLSHAVHYPRAEATNLNSRSTKMFTKLDVKPAFCGLALAAATFGFGVTPAIAQDNNSSAPQNP